MEREDSVWREGSVWPGSGSGSVLWEEDEGAEGVGEETRAREGRTGGGDWICRGSWGEFIFIYVLYFYNL